jgi:hypothetical protein
MNNRKKNTHFNFIVILLIACLFIVASSMMIYTGDVQTAHASGTAGTTSVLSTYLSSDNIVGYSGEIRHYKNTLYGTTSSMYVGNENQTADEYPHLTASGNDPIVGIIPPEYFTTDLASNGKTEIGNEYGFLIKTVAVSPAGCVKNYFVDLGRVDNN